MPRLPPPRCGLEVGMEDVGTHVSGRALGGNRAYSRKTDSEAPSRRPEIEIFLHAKEELGTAACELGKSQRHVRGHPATATQYCMQGLTADTHAARRIGFGQTSVLL